MFKLPDKIPSLRDSVLDIVDYYETECLKSSRGMCSFRAISRSITLGNDEIEITGIEDEDDYFNNDKLNEICIEIDRRRRACNGYYPFVVESHGYVLRLSVSRDERLTVNYAYLLLATRLNMRDNKVHDNVDGTLLFEKVAAKVAENYWGERSQSLVFGTAALENFPEKVNDLCRRLGEGGSYQNRGDRHPSDKDGKLDVVVWKNFSDGKFSKLIGFGQCKTGTTSWKKELGQLQPSIFCQNYFDSQPSVTPVRIFFICDSLPVNEWYRRASEGGIIFDRYRIMDYMPEEIEEEIIDEINKWVRAALEFIGTNMS